MSKLKTAGFYAGVAVYALVCLAMAFGIPFLIGMALLKFLGWL
jgi:hypothetical protein